MTSRETPNGKYNFTKLGVAYIVGLALLGAVSRSATAQMWSQLSPAGDLPSARFGHTAVYNDSANIMTIFGGRDTDVRNDVWTLENADGAGGVPVWTKLSPGGGPPPSRAFHTAVYAQFSNRMIIFGGWPFPFLNDVWILTDADGSGEPSSWVLLNPAGPAPQARYSHTAVYDDNTNVMIVFGGFGDVGGFTTPFNDTWVLMNADGLGGDPTWVQLTPAGDLPLPRGEHSATYDPTTNTMVVFGGNDQVQGFEDGWILSHANGQGGAPQWEQLAPVGAELPPASSHHRAVYNQAKNMMIVTVSNPNTIEVWLLSGANGLGEIPRWTKSPATDSPTWAWEHSTVYNEATDRLILFGGGGCCWTAPFTNDVWVLSGASEGEEQPLTFIRPMEDWDLNGYLFGDDWKWNRCEGSLYKHAGVDVNGGKATVGKAVKASASGVVKEVCFNPVWKYALVIEHDMDGNPDTVDDRVTTVYWHIDPVLSIDLPTTRGCFPASLEVSVEQGEQIATVANMGGLSHLHFGLRWAPYQLNLSDKGALPPVACKGLPAFPEAFVDPLEYLEEEG